MHEIGCNKPSLQKHSPDQDPNRDGLGDRNPIQKCHDGCQSQQQEPYLDVEILI